MEDFRTIVFGGWSKKLGRFKIMSNKTFLANFTSLRDLLRHSCSKKWSKMWFFADSLLRSSKNNENFPFAKAMFDNSGFVIDFKSESVISKLK